MLCPHCLAFTTTMSQKIKTAVHGDLNIRLMDLTPLVSATAFLFSAILVVIQLRNVQRYRFVAITAGIFQAWQSADFMEAQLWIVHELSERSWSEFQEHHGGKDGEVAFMRVTGFYNRAGTLVNLDLVEPPVLLRTIGVTAVSVWTKIAPLVPDARREHPAFLLDFERMVPY